MTLDERALAHGRAALRSPDAERVLGVPFWTGIPEMPLSLLDCPEADDHDGSIDDAYVVIDLACVMYAQDVAAGRHR